jgi:hypothetical protein
MRTAGVNMVVVFCIQKNEGVEPRMFMVVFRSPEHQLNVKSTTATPIIFRLKYETTAHTEKFEMRLEKKSLQYCITRSIE